VTETPVLRTIGISKSFGPVSVLKSINFDAPAGKVTAIVGDNGAGKSTFIKTIAGIHAPDEGEVQFNGETVTIHTPRDASALGIEVVYQDLALCDNLDIVQNMFLGREKVRSGRRLDEEAMEDAARKTLASLNVTTVKSIASLSGGQRQSVAIAKAVMWNSKLVILDEPTAALGVAQTRQVLDLVARLAHQGLSVILISHNLVDVFEVADRIAVLYLGRLVAEVETKAVDSATVVELITSGRSDKISPPLSVVDAGGAA
jgi:D-xylose transport system ATP-binding protein